MTALLAVLVAAHISAANVCDQLSYAVSDLPAILPQFSSVEADLASASADACRSLLGGQSGKL